MEAEARTGLVSCNVCGRVSKERKPAPCEGCGNFPVWRDASMAKLVSCNVCGIVYEYERRPSNCGGCGTFPIWKDVN